MNTPRFLHRVLSWICALLALGSAPTAHALNEIVFEDIFSRRLNERGMTLVDWEGQIANPAIEVFVRPPSDATFPASATISGNAAAALLRSAEPGHRDRPE